MRKHAIKNEPFIREYIPKVSRTFALTIKFLPKALRNSVYTSYLLCRVADTLEDSPLLPREEREKRLLKLGHILNNASRGKAFDKDEIAPLYDSIDAEVGHDHQLLTELSKLFEILESLPQSHRNIIYRWAGEMAEGMAEFTSLTFAENDKIGAIKDSEQWDRYCYYVAGTVGMMLTELFVDHYKFDDNKTGKLIELGTSFGLGLQKVNVIKDVPDDRQRGVCFLPLDIMSNYNLTPSKLADSSESSKLRPFVNHLLTNALKHLDDAIEYSILFPRNYRGTRMFLILPVFLAAETLKLISEYQEQCMIGPPLKIERGEVSRLVTAATLRVSSNESIEKYYRELRPAIEI